MPKSLLAKDADLSYPLKEFQPLLKGLPEFDVSVHPNEGTFVDGIRVIVVKPAKATGKTPAVLWIQGGGFIISTPDHFAKAGFATVLLEYGLAPENPWPTPHNQPLHSGEFTKYGNTNRIWQWLTSTEGLSFVNADPERLVFSGTSCGAILAEVAIIRHKQENPTPGIQPRLVLLDNPILDNRPGLYPSMDQEHPLSPSPFCTAKKNTDALYWLNAPSNWEGFPAYASEEQLRGLPPHHIAIAEIGCFRDEAVVFAQRLMKLGVRMDMRLYVATTHTYSAMFETPASHSTREDYVQICKLAFREL
ncbi:alpha beta-hydrolase [Coniophora puteana RWD-64-598 SS2]|uniref:Alpha beta-hydrolase n=1 Tax=Coniophora puteana (strain RWD-64-598) TaxID=741705 RepID=A0A5M3ML33_CONPW|nr:alpha beta-hydrolase [Coniophora puteana RWD-64-598 SS2]EIW79878.1 alpha beta-hydrolase [Coniophora puteana RWD-64-598 SS2]